MHKKGNMCSLNKHELVKLHKELFSGNYDGLTIGGITVKINHKPYRIRYSPAETLFGRGVVLEGKDIKQAYMLKGS